MEMSSNEKGRMFFFASTGNASFGTSVIIGNLKILIFSYTHTVTSLFCIVSSICFYFSNHIIASVISPTFELWNTFSMQTSSSYFWLSNIIAVSLVMSVELTHVYYKYG